MVFMIAPIASAQTYADILDGRWFKVKGSMKGYMVDANDNETVLGKGSGSGTDYIKWTYNDLNQEYTLLTCTQDDYDPGIWHKTDCGPISTNNIYGAVYPQIWDFDGTPIVFYDGYSTFNLYSILYMKITAEGPTLKKATISTLSCSIWAEIESDSYAIGSCKITGSLIPSDKVATMVPLGCQ
jgi:hypothetical protein